MSMWADDTPATARGIVCMSVLPFPSWPSSLFPQAKMSPPVHKNTCGVWIFMIEAIRLFYRVTVATRNAWNVTPLKTLNGLVGLRRGSKIEFVCSPLNILTTCGDGMQATTFWRSSSGVTEEVWCPSWPVTIFFWRVWQEFFFETWCAKWDKGPFTWWGTAPGVHQTSICDCCWVVSTTRSKCD